MKRLFRACAALLCAVGFSAQGQGIRYDSRATTVQTNMPVGANAPVLAIPGARVMVCTDSACASAASIYQDQGLTVAAPNPLTAGGATPANLSGAWGFWAASGTYWYKITTTQGVVYGPYPFTLGGSGGGGGGMVFPAGTGVAVVTAGASWGTTLAAPVGALVGTTDVQTLTNKTLDGVTPATMAFVDPTSSIQTQLNSKQANLTVTTVGTSGPSTLVGATLNIPQYSSGGGGNVSDSGAPTSGQSAEWISATQIAGVAVSGTGNYVKATSPTLVTPALGTPSSLVLTNATGLPIGSVTGLGVGVATFLATPSSASLASAITDETGTGLAVFATSPILVTPNLGTPSALTLTNATGLVTAGINNSQVTLGKIQNAAANNKLLGSGAAGVGASYSELTVGTNLTITGTTLSAGTGLVASGTTALGTSAIASAACATVVTATATGTATTDAIIWNPNASIKAVTGYVPATTGGLSIAAYPTANAVNFDVCNWSNASITPGAVSINWVVTR